MDCIDLFKKAAAALQTDPRYLELDAARRENDSDEELQNLIGEFNLARLDLNNESAKAETNAARVAELNQRVNDLYSQIMASEGMVRYNAAKSECEAMPVLPQPGPACARGCDGGLRRRQPCGPGGLRAADQCPPALPHGRGQGCPPAAGPAGRSPRPPAGAGTGLGAEMPRFHR